MNAEGPLPNIHQRVSIYSFIRDRLDSSGVLSDSFMRLPDETPQDSGSVRFMAGAMDGAFGHHAGSGQATEKAKRAAATLAAAATKPTRRRLRKLYDALSQDDVLDYIDPMIEELATRRLPGTQVARVGNWPARKLVEYANAAGAIVAGRLLCADAMPTDSEIRDAMEIIDVVSEAPREPSP